MGKLVIPPVIKPETSKKLLISLPIDRKAYRQEFVTAKVQGIDAIIGLDFLSQFDGTIRKKKQTLFTRKGKIILFPYKIQTLLTQLSFYQIYL